MAVDDAGLKAGRAAIREALRQRLEEAGYTAEDIRLILRSSNSEAESGQPRRRGRRTKWSFEHNTQLLKAVVCEIGGLSKRHERKISAACRKLAKEEPWRSLATVTGSNRDPADVLRERYVRLWIGAVDVYEMTEKSGAVRLVHTIKPKAARRSGRAGLEEKRKRITEPF